MPDNSTFYPHNLTEKTHQRPAQRDKGGKQPGLSPFSAWPGQLLTSGGCRLPGGLGAARAVEPWYWRQGRGMITRGGDGGKVA